jgi:hypothetical protein
LLGLFRPEIQRETTAVPVHSITMATTAPAASSPLLQRMNFFSVFVLVLQ